MDSEPLTERSTISILPLGAVAVWAMNHDMESRSIFTRLGLEGMDFLDKRRMLTPSQVAILWDEASQAATKLGLDRIGLQVVSSIPFETFRRSANSTEYLGMESLLYSDTVARAIARYSKFFQIRHLDATLRATSEDDLVSVVWNLGHGDAGPHHADFCVGTLVAALGESLGQPLPLSRVGLGSAEPSAGLTDRLFPGAELVESAKAPFLEFPREALKLRPTNKYPKVGVSLERRLGLAGSSADELIARITNGSAG